MLITASTELGQVKLMCFNLPKIYEQTRWKCMKRSSLVVNKNILQRYEGFAKISVLEKLW